MAPGNILRARSQWTPQITHATSCMCLGTVLLFATKPSSAHDVAIEPPSSPSTLRGMLHGGYTALREDAADTFRMGTNGSALSLAVMLDLLEVMSLAASLGDCDARDVAQADGTFVESTLTLGKIGAVVGLVAEIGYRHFLDRGLTRYAATLGLGATW